MVNFLLHCFMSKTWIMGTDLTKLHLFTLILKKLEVIKAAVADIWTNQYLVEISQV